MSMRAYDADAFVSALCVRASHDLTPVLRLEPRIARVMQSAIDIGNCARGAGPHRNFKLRKLIARLQQQMLEQVDPRYLELLSEDTGRIEGISLIADIPLELLPIRGIPLGFVYDCSRTPATPGNLSFGETVVNRRIEKQLADFANVLVVRSFSANDPIRNSLERAVREFDHRDPKININIVDVGSPKEFVRAINQYSGALLIFDGHGTRDPHHHTGQIVVGGEPMDLWPHRLELQVPPVVLLSACDTLPIDGSHGSSATAMLAVGNSHDAGGPCCRFPHSMLQSL